MTVSYEWKSQIEYIYLQRIKCYLSLNPWHIKLDYKLILNLSFKPDLIYNNYKYYSQIMQIGIDSLQNKKWKGREYDFNNNKYKSINNNEINQDQNLHT